MLKRYRRNGGRPLRAVLHGIAILALGPLLACSLSPLKRLEEAMDPMVGVKKKQEVERVIGEPVQCHSNTGTTRCEYRTLIGRNDPAPATHKKEPGMGPDLSPYEFFDVIEAFYDETGMLKDWHALSIRP